MPTLNARTYDSRFPQAKDTYNGIIAAADGNIYYVLSSQAIDIGAQLYCFDPARNAITHCGDLTQGCGESELRTIAQGKCHSIPIESEGKLYLSTHCGYYDVSDGTERMGSPTERYLPYPGGHFLAYDTVAHRFEDLGLAPDRQAILSLTMDPKTGRLYGLSWPNGLFLVCDIEKRSVRSLGPVSLENENGVGGTYGAVCRSLALDPADGSVYLTTAAGDIIRYRADRETLELVEGDSLRKDYFGQYSPASPGHLGYHWRQTFYYQPEQMIYGIHGNSGYLFRFDPRRESIEVLQRLTSEPSQRAGMFDQFSYGYLGFTLGPDGRSIYYLTGGPIYVDGRRVAGKPATAKGESKGAENLHLITYDIPAQQYRDHGPIFLEDGSRPAYVNSIAVANDGTVYTTARVNEEGRADLISFHPRIETAKCG